LFKLPVIGKVEAITTVYCPRLGGRTCSRKDILTILLAAKLDSIPDPSETM